MRAAAVLLAALALAAPAAAAPPKRGVLVPGASLGGVRLGQPSTAVLARWGRSFGVCGGCVEPTWYFTYEPFQPQGAAVAFARGRVDAVFTLWQPAGWRTTRGIAIGDPVANVTAVYGALGRTDCSGYYALTLPGRGALTSFYVYDEKVWGFGLSRPGAPQCR